ncbi:hypothetical protein PaG_01755 [Moesziomyces aphidis]|uniref:Kinetochore protein Spc24 n=2 Tax=Moesziomyces TaxID=63261 RepID=M9MCD1_PSEA3|nr:hypothetical protein PaG_01755 [Moesziomyces aphidis]GAC73448.1 GYF domain containing proteins [Moesziomyces antarcticus T-34]
MSAVAPRDDSAALMPPPSQPSTSASANTAVVDEARLTDDDIDALISSLQPHEELDQLRAIEKTIRETQSRRRREDEEMRAKMHALDSALSDLRKQSTRQAADWRSLAQHAETIEKLDNRNFDLAKKINEQESLLSSLQTELLELKRSAEELEEIDVEDESEMDKDATDATDEWSTLLVRSDTRNSAIHFDIHTAHLKQNEISPLVLADQLWKAAE